MKAKIAIPALVLVAVLAAGGVLAQSAPPNDSAWRYRMQKVDEGFLRLDAQTGQVSLCKSRDGAWTCESVADDRAAYEAEIGRLQNRVAALERQVKDTNVPGPGMNFRMPTEQEIDQAVSLFERFARRLRGVVENLKKESGTPDKG